MNEPPENVVRLKQLIRDCTLCPRNCHVDRVAGERGACRVGQYAVVASAGPHFGEESVLVGRGGSGTIFMAGCNLDCRFCQNWDISHSTSGREVSAAELAAMALNLEQRGCVNINFVTPTHISHAVAEAIWIARGEGLKVPVIYNCGGYEAVTTLALLEGLIEIYMPDFKYADTGAGQKYSGVPDYPGIATAALAEMYRQVGVLRVDGLGAAMRGLLVRHLVMPHDVARSRKVIDLVARTAPGCAINVMGQYHPAFKAGEFSELVADVEPGTVDALRQCASTCGLIRVD